MASLLHIPKSKIRWVIKKLNSILTENGIMYVCVKEGTGEKLIEDYLGDTKRFFAFYQEDELLKLFEDYFTLLELKRVQLNKTIFLQAFFRKKEPDAIISNQETV